jgi:hypothetical protein
VASKKKATMGMRPARRTATAALLATALAWTGPVWAETDTLARGAMDLVGTPLDLALSPYTASSTFVRKFYVNGKQPPLEKALLTPVLGGTYILSCTVLYTVAGVMRFTDGLVNVPVGLAALASEKEPDTSLYEPVHGEYGAVVDAGPIYFGGYYCEGFFQ